MSTPISPRSRRRVLHTVARTATSLFVVGAVAAAGCVGVAGGTSAAVTPPPTPRSPRRVCPSRRR
ncbi:hypothetical protein [Pseudonocardia sp. ICBG601]|uniref:hypothetical protein n=1 Tax=Pseudonocardia sp. ICBG601 TaxID=2846759 RepID=UPI001CF6B18C|nr:hypothetical protein [Pseudonocardia sp. ICBG601]